MTQTVDRALVILASLAEGPASLEQAANRIGVHKSTAMRLLQAKLMQVEMDKKKAELDRQYGEKSDVAWGSQIRSYVFQPYQKVIDLRTGVETSDVQGVMNGDIDAFIEGKLRGLKRQKGVSDDEA